MPLSVCMCVTLVWGPSARRLPAECGDEKCGDGVMTSAVISKGLPGSTAGRGMTVGTVGWTRPRPLR